MMPPPWRSSIAATFLTCLFYIPAVFAQSASAPIQTTPIVAPTQTKKWTGDLDEILKHRFVRVAVPYSKTFYYTVKGVQWGVAYEGGKAFEKYLNKKYPQKDKNIKIHAMFFVTPRDKVYQNLNDGVVDLVIGGLTITPERKELVDFSVPTVSDINEIVVTGSNSPQFSSLGDLAGKEVYVRKTSSYWEHLEGLNERLIKEGKAPIKLIAVPEDLADEDLLEMVTACFRLLWSTIGLPSFGTRC